MVTSVGKHSTSKQVSIVMYLEDRPAEGKERARGRWGRGHGVAPGDAQLLQGLPIRGKVTGGEGHAPPEGIGSSRWKSLTGVRVLFMELKPCRTA
jgi:hypothetical protein